MLSDLVYKVIEKKISLLLAKLYDQTEISRKISGAPLILFQRTKVTTGMFPEQNSISLNKEDFSFHSYKERGEENWIFNFDAF